MRGDPGKLFLYGTHGCELCEEAKLLVREVLKKRPGQFEARDIDIAESQTLMQQYGIRIPVLKHVESGLELGWPFDGDDLEAFLESID